MIMSDQYESETYDRNKNQGFNSLGKRDLGSIVTKLENRFDRDMKRPYIPTLRPTGLMLKLERSEDHEVNGFKRLKV